MHCGKQKTSAELRDPLAPTWVSRSFQEDSRETKLSPLGNRVPSSSRMVHWGSHFWFCRAARGKSAAQRGSRGWEPAREGT